MFRFQIIILLALKALLPHSLHSQQNARWQTLADSVVFFRQFSDSTSLLASRSNFTPSSKLYFNDSLIAEYKNPNLRALQVSTAGGNFYFVDKSGPQPSLLRLNQASGQVDTVLMDITSDLVGIVGNLLIGVERSSSLPVPEKPITGNVSGGTKNETQWKRTLVAFDLTDFKKDTLLMLEHPMMKYGEDIYSVFIFPKSTRLLIQTGIFESGDYAIEKRLVFDLNDRSVKETPLPPFITQLKNPKYRWGESKQVTSYDSEMRVIFTDKFIINDQFEILGYCLTKSDPVFHESFSNGGSSFVPSYLDNRKNGQLVRTAVQFTDSWELEKSLFKVYTDSLIYRNDLTTLSRDDLNILRNLIFAKHNYAFESEYYQAIFNLFSFYNSEIRRRKRTREVNELLSEQDKKNLSILKEEIDSRMN